MHLPRVLTLSALLVCSIGCQSDAGSQRATAACPATTPSENEGMHARNLELAQRAQAHPNARLVFLGDSITQSWEAGGSAAWEREIEPYGALNLGVSGDRTEHVLWRLEQGSYDQLHPQRIVLMLGTNNTGHRMDPPEQIAAGLEAVLAALRQRYPETRVTLLSIFPRGATVDDPMRRNNDATNALLVALAQRSGAELLDLSSIFLDDQGALAPELMPDLLHPNTRGYELWAEALREPLRRWLGQPGSAAAH